MLAYPGYNMLVWYQLFAVYQEEREVRFTTPQAQCPDLACTFWVTHCVDVPHKCHRDPCGYCPNSCQLSRCMSLWFFRRFSKTFEGSRRWWNAQRKGSVLMSIYIRLFSSIELACAVRQPSPCVRALCESGVLFHMSHLKLHFALHTSHCTLHTPHCTLHTPHFSLHTALFPIHTSHFTARFPLHTPHFTRHTPHFTLHTPHFTLHSSRPTLHTALFTLHTSSHLCSSHLIPAHLFSSHLFSYVT